MSIDTRRLIGEAPYEGCCTICLELIHPDDALQAPCGHFWCSACIRSTVNAGHILCPMHRTPVEPLQRLSESNNLFYRYLSSVTVKCVRHEDGCPWQGELSEVRRHEANCTAPHCQCCMQRVAELNTTIEALLAVRDEAEGQLAVLQTTLADSQEQVTSLEQQMLSWEQATAARVTADLEAVHLAREAELERARADEVELLRKDMAALESSLQESARALSESSAALLAAQREAEGLRGGRARLEAAQVAASEAAEARREAEERQMALLREVDKLQARLGETGGELKALREQAGDAEAQAERARATCQYLAGEITKSQKKLEVAEGEREQYKRQLAQVAQLLTGGGVAPVATPVIPTSNGGHLPGSSHPHPSSGFEVGCGAPAWSASAMSHRQPSRSIGTAASLENSFSPDDLPLPRSFVLGPSSHPIPDAEISDGEGSSVASGDAHGIQDAHLAPSRSLSNSGRSSVSVSASERGSNGHKKCVLTLTGHNGHIRALAFAPDGVTLWTASSDSTIRSWLQGKCVSVLGAVKSSWSLPGGRAKDAEGHHTGGVNALAMAPDCKLWSGGEDKTIRCWRQERCVTTLTGHKGAVLALQLAPDGALWSASQDATIRKWVGNVCREVLEHPQMTAVHALAIDKSPRDSTPYSLYSGSADGTIRRWVGNQCMARLEGHSGPVNALALMPDGTLWSGGSDQSLRKWQRDACTAIVSKDRHASDVCALAVDACGLLWSGSSDCHIKSWRDGKCVATMKNHTGWVCTLAVPPDGSVWSGSRDKTIRAWRGS
eukprot:jgi/Mesen1/4476/ME000228S03449